MTYLTLAWQCVGCQMHQKLLEQNGQHDFSSVLIILANIRYFGVNSDCQTSIAHLLLDNQPYEFRLKFENVRNEKVQIPFDTTQKNIVTIRNYPSSTMFPP